MEGSPSKRRKTSPTTSIPIDAPTTPSRIPVPKAAAQTGSARRPSFASPTKASIAKHNPQLLNRPTSSGTGSGKNLDDVFAKALGEIRPSVEGQSVVTGEERLAGEERSASTTQENEPDTQTIMQNQRRRSIGGGMAQKPRRASKSPVKKADKIIEPMWTSEADVNPFVKKGLRRTPPPSSQAEAVIEEGLDPFKKKGLRRSPVGSSRPVVESQKENEVIPDVTTTPTEPIPRARAVEIVRKPALRRSPIGSSQPTEDIQMQGLHAEQLPATGRRTRSSKSPIGSKLVGRSPNHLEAQELPKIPRRAGLRRSPIASQPVQQSQNDLEVEENLITPRRAGLRRSPIASQSAEQTQNELQPKETPIVPRRGGLRRSPVVLQAAEGSQNSIQNVEQPIISRSTGLRRSPVRLQPVDSQQENLNVQVQPEVSNTPTEPISSSIPEVVREGQSTESPVRSPKRSLPPVRTKMPEIFPIKPKSTQPEEPQLPPTPKQLGIDDPIVTTPPIGIHDTPSKRARQSKVVSEKLKSSPLKPKDPPPSANKMTFHGPTEPLPGILKKPAQEQASEQGSESKPVLKRRKSARFLIPEDPYAAKKRERDELLQELQRLQADVALANAENERLRLRSETKGKGKGTATGSNQTEVLEMLRRVTAPPQTSVPREKPKSIFKSIDAFLPFRSKRMANPQKVVIAELPLPSHLPLVLDDPLPYLQAFTPLTWSSTITMLPSKSQSQSTSSTTSETGHSVLQKHVLTASHPHGLFSSRLSLTVHTPSLTIQDIRILRLPMFAEHELGSFIRPKARADGPLGGNVGVITWAMGRWCEVSIKRAGIWFAIESQLGTAEARRKTFQSSRKRKRHRGASIANEHDEDQEQDEEILDAGKIGKWSRKQLLPHLGRSSMDLSNDNVELRFEWRLDFDWTGEVESKLGATARVPKTWHDQDERSSLSKIPDMFDRLVSEKGPLDAVRAVVSLMMGSD